jgi:hypothetical protein
MKKIILPFEGTNFPEEALEFVRRLNSLSPVLLTAAFAPEVSFSYLWNMSDGADNLYIPLEEDEEAEIKENSARLQAFCHESGIELSIHRDDSDFALPSIRKEARFADLLMLSGQHFFEHAGGQQPNVYLKEILHSAECPILIIPDKSELPRQLILTYDGSPQSIFAIKQFTYIFPELSGTPAVLVHIHENKEDPFPEESLIKELAAKHFKDLRILNLQMRPQDFFDVWMAEQNNPWLISGSYGRSELSLLFSKSFIAGMVRNHKVPVFIAHN